MYFNEISKETLFWYTRMITVLLSLQLHLKSGVFGRQEVSEVSEVDPKPEFRNFRHFRTWMFFGSFGGQNSTKRHEILTMAFSNRHAPYAKDFTSKGNSLKSIVNFLLWHILSNWSLIWTIDFLSKRLDWIRFLPLIFTFYLDLNWYNLLSYLLTCKGVTFHFSAPLPFPFSFLLLCWVTPSFSLVILHSWVWRRQFDLDWSVENSIV
jgi:hypothetical protein